MVAGYAIGGGHVLHVVCDLTIAADNAVFGQTGPRVHRLGGDPEMVVHVFGGLALEMWQAGTHTELPIAVEAMAEAREIQPKPTSIITTFNCGKVSNTPSVIRLTTCAWQALECSVISSI